MGRQWTTTDTAKLVGLLDANGSLRELDSLMVANLATALEEKLSVRIPMALLTEETFAAIAQVPSTLPPKTRAV